MNRLEEIEYGEPNSAQVSTFVYDDISRMTSATNHVGTVTFAHDNRNRLISTTDVFGQQVGYEYVYNASTNQKQLKLNGSLYATYNFDDASRLSNVVNAADAATVTFGYDNENKLTSRVFPNGITTTYTYDGMDRLTSLQDFGGTVNIDRQYGYNAASQIETITEPTNTRQFGYDESDRLKNVIATNNQNESYTYDKVGNRLTSHLSSAYGYQPNNRLTSADNATYKYDANGNPYQKWDGKLWRFTWDHENRLSFASDRKTTVSYQYDALGRRVARHGRDEGGSTKFTYDGQDVLVDEHESGQTKYLNGLGIDNKLRQTKGADTSYFLTDHLGSTNALTDANGNLTSQASYDSFGNQSGDIATRYGFTGREKDDFTGLMYYRARWYDAKIGRFISEDPIGLSGGINQYSYVGNTPTGYTDPFGLYEIDVHYYLTKYLAQQTGCFGKDQAKLIAEGNQRTDEDQDKEPGQGRALQNTMYHALHPGAAPGFGSPHLLWRVRTSGYNLERLGNSLHYLQDTFSHEGYPHPNWGHATGMHGVDKTATDVEKTVRMAKSTFAALSRFANEACGCDVSPWNSSMEDVIRKFARVQTERPNRADIEGETGVDKIGRVPDWASPRALNRKIEILGVKRR